MENPHISHGLRGKSGFVRINGVKKTVCEMVSELQHIQRHLEATLVIIYICTGNTPANSPVVLNWRNHEHHDQIIQNMLRLDYRPSIQISFKVAVIFCLKGKMNRYVKVWLFCWFSEVGWTWPTGGHVYTWPSIFCCRGDSVGWRGGNVLWEHWVDVGIRKGSVRAD